MTYAVIESRRAALAGEFGREMLVRKFGAERAAEILARFGCFARGKNKGQPRGFLHWQKCTRGGWVRTQVLDGGYVQTPGSYDYAVSLEWNLSDDPSPNYALGAPGAGRFKKETAA